MESPLGELTKVALNYMIVRVILVLLKIDIMGLADDIAAFLAGEHVAAVVQVLIISPGVFRVGTDLILLAQGGGGKQHRAEHTQGQDQGKQGKLLHGSDLHGCDVSQVGGMREEKDFIRLCIRNRVLRG